MSLLLYLSMSTMCPSDHNNILHLLRVYHVWGTVQGAGSTAETQSILLSCIQLDRQLQAGTLINVCLWFYMPWNQILWRKARGIQEVWREVAISVRISGKDSLRSWALYRDWKEVRSERGEQQMERPGGQRSLGLLTKHQGGSVTWEE